MDGGTMKTDRESTETARPPRAVTTAEETPLEGRRQQNGAHTSGPRELRAILSAALDAIPSAAFLLTSAGAIFEVNAAGREWLGRDETREGMLRQALRGRPPADLAITRISGGSGAFLLVHRDLVEERDRASLPPPAP
jgi:PAS domain-containing protein